MIEALRGLGYSTAAALADIVDNSIAAGATDVRILFSWQGDASAVSINDNGTGMDDDGLDRAMRLGDRSPLDERASTDLGRFGLGLKTASFSQCRRLTVASFKDEKLSCLRWDLDVLAASKNDRWELLEGAAPGSEKFISEFADAACGTMVLWEQLDRIIAPGFGEKDFLDLIDIVERHLAMVFHRFLSVRGRLNLQVNGRPVKPWDPFMLAHPATWSSPVVRMGPPQGKIEIQCHVLPHKDKLTRNEFERGAGTAGWTAQQGFYVYRNERLLVSGSWLGLGRGRTWIKEESQRLARIRIDISNTADIAWKIDIRKSTAKPPIEIREQLVLLAEEARRRARRVFAHRGVTPRTREGAEIKYAWVSEQSKAGIRYRIDTNHPAIKAVIDSAGQGAPALITAFKIIEESVPVQRIWLDTAEAKETPRASSTGQASAQLVEVLRAVFDDMTIRRAMSPEAAMQALGTMDPFHNYPTLISALSDSNQVE